MSTVRRAAQVPPPLMAGQPASAATEMVKKVARAIDDAYVEATAQNMTEGEAQMLAARRAIAAMRDPTEAMITASRQALGKHIRSLPASERTPAKGYVGGYMVYDERLKARVRYNAMIDAAAESP